jgi:hypothetical protein
MEKRPGISAMSIVIMLMLLMGAFFVVATDDVIAAQEGDYLYTTGGSPTVATITAYLGDGGAVTIPSTLGGFPTAAIGNSAFNFCENLTSVIIPNSVKTIGTAAFDSCVNLTSVSIPSSVTTIGPMAFQYCSSLTSLVIPNSVTSIGVKAFYFCTALSSITISNGITVIANELFRNCPSLTSITIPGGVTSIGTAAFNYCTNLTSITFNGLVAPTTVGANWIMNTSALLTGHANISSNFPHQGNAFNGLMMGAYNPVPPQPPTALTTTPGNEQAFVSWTAPADNGWSVITGYKLYRSDTENGTYAVIASPVGLNYTDTGLTNGQTYWYKVSAVNIAGESAKSPATAAVIPKPSTANDDAMIILLAVIAIVAVMVTVFLVMRRRK